MYFVIGPPSPPHLFPASVCSLCWCAFGDRCRPSRANIYLNSLIFFQSQFEIQSQWGERHNQQQIPQFLSMWYVWTYFHMLWTVPDNKQQQLATGKHWWYQGISDLEESFVIHCSVTIGPLFHTCHIKNSIASLENICAFVAHWFLEFP